MTSISNSQHPGPINSASSSRTKSSDAEVVITQVPSFQTLPSFLQQYPCCEDCEVTPEPYQCQPKNHDYYHEQNSCNNSNSFGFDHGQPPRYIVNHPIFNTHNDLLTSQTTLMEQMTTLTSMCEMACQIVQKKLEEKQTEEEQATQAQNSKIPACSDDDDDYSAITPNEPVDSQYGGRASRHYFGNGIGRTHKVLC
nr:hypothetical protein [Tanacetum cinerariifolium]